MIVVETNTDSLLKWPKFSYKQSVIAALVLAKMPSVSSEVKDDMTAIVISRYGLTEQNQFSRKYRW
jgi:hypothetical protein